MVRSGCFFSTPQSLHSLKLFSQSLFLPKVLLEIVMCFTSRESKLQSQVWMNPWPLKAWKGVDNTPEVFSGWTQLFTWHFNSRSTFFSSISHLLPGALRGHTSYYKKSILFHRKLLSAADLVHRLEVQDRGWCWRCIQPCNHSPTSRTHTLFFSLHTGRLLSCWTQLSCIILHQINPITIDQQKLWSGLQTDTTSLLSSCRTVISAGERAKGPCYYNRNRSCTHWAAHLFSYQRSAEPHA